jgi:hypothetical protein
MQDTTDLKRYPEINFKSILSERRHNFKLKKMKLPKLLWQLCTVGWSENSISRDWKHFF